MNQLYKNKYLKYKNKYLNLVNKKKQKGGMILKYFSKILPDLSKLQHSNAFANTVNLNNCTEKNEEDEENNKEEENINVELSIEEEYTGKVQIRIQYDTSETEGETINIDKDEPINQQIRKNLYEKDNRTIIEIKLPDDNIIEEDDKYESLDMDEDQIIYVRFHPTPITNEADEGNIHELVDKCIRDKEECPYGEISHWNVIDVKDMSYLFTNSDFNENISEWNVSKVTNMESMFENAKKFNQNISNWYVKPSTNMNDMFNGADLYLKDNPQPDWYFSD